MGRIHQRVLISFLRLLLLGIPTREVSVFITSVIFIEGSKIALVLASEAWHSLRSRFV